MVTLPMVYGSNKRNWHCRFTLILATWLAVAVVGTNFIWFIGSIGFIDRCTADNLPIATQIGEVQVEAINIPPRIWDVDLLNETNVSCLDRQIDVNHEYHFKLMIRDNDTLEDLVSINIYAWYDDGDERTQKYIEAKKRKERKPNYMFDLKWHHETGFSLEYPTTGELTLGNCVYRPIDAYNATFEFYFTPGNQTHCAIGDGRWEADRGNDRYSWNFQIVAVDTKPNHGLSGEPEDYWEFGIYQHTAIVLNQTVVTKGGYPGENITTTPLGVTLVSNGAYIFNISLLEPLRNPNTAVVIRGTNVGVLSGYPAVRWHSWFTIDYPSNITVKEELTAPAEGTEALHTVTYCIKVPLGTPAYVYSARVKYELIQTFR
jgi:hypothetical protein